MNAPMTAPRADAVLAFWFGAAPLATRAEWFRKDPAFDDAVRQRFGASIEAALAGTLGPDWSTTPAQRLAQLLMLDQFTRNIFRGSARAFAGDERALGLARALVADGSHLALAPLQRWFVYLPYEHAEDSATQDDSVRLFEALASADPALAGALDYAQRHRDVIRRFGRFPHRNALLGRDSSADELAYLQQPGSGF
ncbi:MAG: DUF924 family protein [Rubrivivax sp.]|nr:DUF924 family protein [Rubrivivax sp.]MDP3082956.1 DUF924 family protein [Rubrivivax sp.]